MNPSTIARPHEQEINAVTDDDFELHVDQLAARVRETKAKLDTERSAGRQPDKSLVIMCDRLDRALAEYRRAGNEPQ